MKALLKDKLQALPTQPGVYLFKDKNREVVYIGKAKNLRKRVVSYFKNKGDLKNTILLNRLYDLDYIVVGSELDALILEDELVKKYKPRYNVALRDDKAYPFLKLTLNEPWPRLFLVRRKEKDGALYFGRFQGGMVRAVIQLVKKLFPIRWCKESPLRRREQPCLYYRLGNCSGPCIGKISSPEYRELAKGIIFLLEGKMESAIKKLKEEMYRAAQMLNFERAAYLRDHFRILEKMLEGQLLRRAPSPRLLAEVGELQKALKLKKAPLRIEAFDVSNLQGANMVGALVTFMGGLPLKSDYRRFKIKSLERKPDDLAAIYEIVKRRYAGSLAAKMPFPDLILVDGGIAQVRSGKKACAEANLKIPIIGLAKKKEEVFFPQNNLPLQLSPRSPALQLLQRIRDEAHRFALTFHRQKRNLKHG